MIKRFWDAAVCFYVSTWVTTQERRNQQMKCVSFRRSRVGTESVSPNDKDILEGYEVCLLKYLGYDAGASYPVFEGALKPAVELNC
jgi:hypothetical protein